VGKAEMNMATQLVKSMSVPWEPEKYHDDYREALQKLIEKKIEHGGEELPAPKKAKKATEATDLVAILQQSIRHNRRGGNDGHLDGQAKGRKSKSRLHLN
jgi:DNA end-binding protein Ku